MRIPNRLATKDVFTPSIATPGHVPSPGGGDGSLDPGGSNPGGSGGQGNGPGGTSVVVPVVYFYDASVGAPTAWSWSFETSDGVVLGTSAVQDPIFTFPGSGTYMVSLITNLPLLETYVVGGNVVPGNIDLYARPIVVSADGSFSTVRTISISEDANEVLIPTVIVDHIASNEEAIAYYQSTGQHLGKFSSVDLADAYAAYLHDTQDVDYGRRVVIHTVVVL